MHAKNVKRFKVNVPQSDLKSYVQGLRTKSSSLNFYFLASDEKV